MVRQRLKLAAVAPSLLDAYAEVEMTLDQLMAFTVNPDHARQEQVWEALQRHYSRQPYEIRRMLTEGAVRASDRLPVRATRGAATLKAAVQANDLQRIRRFSLTLSVLKVLSLAYAAPLTSRNQMERFTALAAVDVCSTRPLLGAAILLRRNDRSLRELRRVFPQHRRLIDRVHMLSLELDGRLPSQPMAEPLLNQEAQRANRPNPSAGALNAARQAVSELGFDADRQSLLARADSIWKRESCVML